jgi:hypothetical protein
MSRLLPDWQSAVQIQDPNMDLHDLQGTVGLVRYMDQSDDGGDEDQLREDLETCEAEKVVLEQENADLREELDILEVTSPVSYYDSASCLHQHSPAYPCYNTTTTIQMYTSWVIGASSSEWIVQRVDTVNGGPLSCLQGDGRFDVVRVSNGQIQNLTAGRNTRNVDTIALIVGEVYEVYVVFNNFGGRPECSRTTLLGSFTATSNGPVPI